MEVSILNGYLLKKKEKKKVEFALSLSLSLPSSKPTNLSG